MWTEKFQNTDEYGAKFGYVGEGAQGAGYFFTWHSTLKETLASIERDTLNKPLRLTRRGVLKAVRAAWREERQKPGYSSLIPGQSGDPEACRSRKYRQSEACRP